MMKLVIALLACTASVLAQAQYPTRPVRLVVASVPRSVPDVLARILAEQTGYGRKLLVENRPGAGGSKDSSLRRATHRRSPSSCAPIPRAIGYSVRG